MIIDIWYSTLSTYNVWKNFYISRVRCNILLLQSGGEKFS